MLSTLVCSKLVRTFFDFGFILTPILSKFKSAVHTSRPTANKTVLYISSLISPFSFLYLTKSSPGWPSLIRSPIIPAIC
ncbi:hypothetical protein BpHYR1_028449 [Brachionus plicatilis]|uniref:Uncharacterized protein n=1 Tax=Brachionus plicatilis TaxID=10195 RepID=A0A3M7QCY7_BRAPC|nr:hypothetical protein BpHYR1_028449 [Brachionus plicatilis]